MCRWGYVLRNVQVDATHQKAKLRNALLKLCLQGTGRILWRTSSTFRESEASGRLIRNWKASLENRKGSFEVFAEVYASSGVSFVAE